MIAAGRLNKRVQLQKKIPIKNEFGHKSKTDYSPVCKLWASVDPVSARQIVASQQKIGEVTHLVKIRFREGISDQFRFVFKERVFDIVHAINVKEAGVILEVLCKEVLSNGNNT